MSETPVPASRADGDILNDVERLIYQYPPLNNDRHQFKATVKNGVVSVSGYVQTWNTRRYLELNLPKINGVTGIDLSRLFDDDSIRIELGQVVPVGVIANVNYGTVVLTGDVPEGMTAEQVAAQIGTIQGVRRAVTAFRD